MIATNDDDVAVLCRALKAHASGRNGEKAARILGLNLSDFSMDAQSAGDALYDPFKYYNYLIGDNSRLDTVQAAVLQVKLRHLDEFTQKRTEIARRYTQGLADAPLQLPQFMPEGMKPCWHQYALMAEDRDALTHTLNEAGIGTGAFYPMPLHLQKAFQGLGYREGSLPLAEKACRQSVCLPIFPELTAEEAEYIIGVIRAHYGLA